MTYEGGDSMYKSIREFYHSYLLLSELHMASRRTAKIVSRHVSEDSFIDRQLEALAASTDNLEEVLKKLRRNRLALDLAEKDARRDDVYRSLVSFLTGLSNMRIMKERKDAADYLLGIIHNQGRNIDKWSYIRESSTLKVILEQFESKAAKKAILLTNVASIVQELQGAQADFESTYQDKVIEEACNDHLETTEIRREIAYRLDASLSYLDAVASDSLDTYRALVNELNEAITDIISKARSRRTRNENAVDTPDQETGEPSESENDETV